MTIRGRFAPSPTGDLHLGHARTALIAWLAARSEGGRFVLRVEDLDPQRSKRVFEERQCAQLRWLGLDWDEGPDVGGKFGPYRQSERFDSYAEALRVLKTYPCSCSRKDLATIASAPEGGERVYDRRCLQGTAPSERRAARRLHVQDGTVISFDDLVQGHFQQDLNCDVGDFVVQRHDEAWSYQLAVVVDDAAMEVNQIVRGADLLSSTPRQIYLQRLLGHASPSYAHVPLLNTDDGIKLSKRRPDQGATLASLAELMSLGSDPGEVVAAVADSLGLLDPGIRTAQPRDLVRGFQWGRVNKAPAVMSLAFGAPRDPSP